MSKQTQKKLCVCVCSLSCSVLHLLHQPWRAAGEQTGAGGVCAQRVGGHDSISGQLLRAGVKGQAGAAGRLPFTGGSERARCMMSCPWELLHPNCL